MQDANTRDFLVDMAEALCLITECMTLEPGDVIITGTPAETSFRPPFRGAAPQASASSIFSVRWQIASADPSAGMETSRFFLR